MRQVGWCPLWHPCALWMFSRNALRWCQRRLCREWPGKSQPFGLGSKQRMLLSKRSHRCPTSSMICLEITRLRCLRAGRTQLHWGRQGVAASHSLASPGHRTPASRCSTKWRTLRSIIRYPTGICRKERCCTSLMPLQATCTYFEGLH